MESRHTSQTMLKCLDCGWVGAQEDCRHGYIGVQISKNEGDAAPEDFCPKCDSTNLIPAEELLV